MEDRPLLLTEPGQLAALLQRHGISNDKSLGQHFLISPTVIQSIVKAAEPYAGLLEVGPGPGCITRPLSFDHPVVAVEFDRRFDPVLAETSPSATIFPADALKLDLGRVLAQMDQPRAIVSNMPYYITGPLLAKFLECADSWKAAILMMQQEVADRILAPAGNSARGALSVVIEYQMRVTRVCKVPAGAFMPPPKVQSTVLMLEPYAEADRAFELFVHKGFRQPRKTLANNIQTRDLGDLPPSIRPHQLTLEDWQTLYGRLRG